MAERGLAFMSQGLTSENRGPVFDPEQPAPADADAYARIAAFAGRLTAHREPAAGSTLAPTETRWRRLTRLAT